MEEQISEIPQPEIPNVPDKKVWPWKLIAIVLLFAIGIIGVLIGKQLVNLQSKEIAPAVVTTSPSPTTTQVLNTYNHSAGFSFKYPSQVTIDEYAKFIRLSWSFKDQYDFNTGLVEVVSNPNSLSATKYAQTKLCESSYYRESCEKIVDESIGPWGGSEFSDEGVSATYNLAENESSAYVFPFKNKFIIFRFSGETGSLVENLDFDTIQTIVNSLDTR